jgi:two-component system NtrC family sensor kinase
LRLTLGDKGLVAFVALLLYLALAGLYLAHERGRALDILQQLKQSNADHEFLTKVNTALTHSVVALQISLNSGTPPRLDIALDAQAFRPDLSALAATFPETATIIARLERHLDQLDKGGSRDVLVALRDSEQELAAQLENIETGVQRHGERLSQQYSDLSGSVMAVLGGMALLGLAIFGATLGSFFSRLVTDVKTLEARAAAIVKGQHGPLLPLTRSDELGSLIAAVNRMESESTERERQHELSREQRFHQEKMAAVGALAAAVAHEVSNPINSISGIAQYTIESLDSHKGVDEAMLRSNADFTLKQTERIGMIMRRLADLAAPASPEPEPNNINELVQATCGFLRYDKRFRHIDLVLDLARGIPAVRAVSDHLTQVLMNLLINAADATEGVTERAAVIRISTRRAEREVVLSVSDNGHGMDAAVLARAFTDSFTTKPVGKGRGIGLYLCRKLIEEMAGRIALESAPGVGTTARVWLPTVQAGAQAG